MSILSTKAIVLSAIKFGDTSLVVKCFTEKEGIKSYLLKGVLTSKKGKLRSAYFQLFNQLEIIASHNNKGNLNSIREVRVIHSYQTIHQSVVKQSIVLFLSEVVASVIKEEEQNVSLYQYLETTVIWLDTHQSVSNFHLLFLLKLSNFLGFYPNISQHNLSAFSLLQGTFTESIYDKQLITGQELKLFKKLLHANFDTIATLQFSKKERQVLLRILIQYFELHLNGFNKPKSLDVLEIVFN